MFNEVSAKSFFIYSFLYFLVKVFIKVMNQSGLVVKKIYVGCSIC